MHTLKWLSLHLQTLVSSGCGCCSWQPTWCDCLLLCGGCGIRLVLVTSKLLAHPPYHLVAVQMPQLLMNALHSVWCSAAVLLLLRCWHCCHWQSDKVLYIVTEPVVPLQTHLPDNTAVNELGVSWGVHQVAVSTCTVSWGVHQVAVSTCTVPWGVHQVAVSTCTVSWGVHQVAVSTCTVSWGVHQVAVSTCTVSWGVHQVAVSICTVSWGVHPSLVVPQPQMRKMLLFIPRDCFYTTLNKWEGETLNLIIKVF